MKLKRGEGGIQQLLLEKCFPALLIQVAFFLHPFCLMVAYRNQTSQPHEADGSVNFINKREEKKKKA